MTPKYKPTYPSGQGYLLARWRELASGDATPWWAQGHGIGLRLRLDELIAVAAAGQEGALNVRALGELSSEAKRELASAKGFLNVRYPTISQHILDALSGEGGLISGGRAHGAVEAASTLLGEPGYGEALCAELAARATKSKTVDELGAIDEMIELFDAELLFYGHSSAWRARAVDRVSAAVAGGAELKAALADAFDNAGQAEDMSVVLSLEGLRRPESPRVELQTHDEEGILTKIAGWGVDVDPGLLDFPDGAVAYDIRAVDPEAAMARALEWFEVQRSIWRLQDGEGSASSRVLVFGTSTRTVFELERPAAIDLLPQRIAAFQEALTQHRLGAEPSELADAFVQLSQARSGLPGAAIADLWSVAEPLFSGVASESGSGAAKVMAGLAQYLYVRDVLAWLGAQFADIADLKDLRSQAGQARADWALELIAKETDAVLQAVDGEAHPLVFLRTMLVLKWDTGKRLKQDLERIESRFTAVASRAYLIRNLVVHRGQPQRARALAATFRPFAFLLRACLDHLAEPAADSRRKPAMEAQLAFLRVRTLADDYASQREKGPNAVRAAVDLT